MIECDICTRHIESKQNTPKTWNLNGQPVKVTIGEEFGHKKLNMCIHCVKKALKGFLEQYREKYLYGDYYVYIQALDVKGQPISGKTCKDAVRAYLNAVERTVEE